MNKAPASCSSVEKALYLLLAFAPSNQEMGTTELSTKVGLHKSTTSRLLRLLVDTGFLQQNPSTKKYLLGTSAYRIGYAASTSLEMRLRATALPFLSELSQITGESVAMEVLTGFNVILAQHVEGPSHLRFNFQQGEIVPIHVAAGSKIILCHRDDDFLDSCLQREFEKFNDQTIVSKEEYRTLLSSVKEDGVAYDKGERYQDIHAMAVAIENPAGPPTAAVIIAGPVSRLTDSFLESSLPSLKRCARGISKKLYG